MSMLTQRTTLWRGILRHLRSRRGSAIADAAELPTSCGAQRGFQSSVHASHENPRTPDDVNSKQHIALLKTARRVALHLGQTFLLSAHVSPVTMATLQQQGGLLRTALPRHAFPSTGLQTRGSDCRLAATVRMMAPRDPWLPQLTLKRANHHPRAAAADAAAAADNNNGLGGSLKAGYVMRNHVVIDEEHAVEPTGDVIEKLKKGFKSFREGEFKLKRELYAKLAEGQEPKVMMITCADSRVCPTMLHGLEAGEAFIVRNVANLVPPCESSGEHHGTSAAIEFAVSILQVEHIVVMGHSSCGGIRALMTQEVFSGDFVGSWVRIGLPAKKKTVALMGGRPLKDQCSFCEQEAVNVSLANLLTFPFIEERIRAGKLHIHGMHYDFIEGKLTSWQVVREEPPAH